MRHFSRGMRRMTWRCGGMIKRCAVLVLVLQFLMLSACTQRTNIVKFSDVDLTDVVIAISMNYQVRKIDIAEQRGCMILVRKDGFVQCDSHFRNGNPGAAVDTAFPVFLRPRQGLSPLHGRIGTSHRRFFQDQRPEPYARSG